jgi:hypothetical protein
MYSRHSRRAAFWWKTMRLSASSRRPSPA